MYFQVKHDPNSYTGNRLTLGQMPPQSGLPSIQYDISDLAISMTDKILGFFFKSRFNPKCTRIANSFFRWWETYRDNYMFNFCARELSDDQIRQNVMSECRRFHSALRKIPGCGKRSIDERPCMGVWGAGKSWEFPGLAADMEHAIQVRKEAEADGRVRCGQPNASAQTPGSFQEFGFLSGGVGKIALIAGGVYLAVLLLTSLTSKRRRRRRRR